MIDAKEKVLIEDAMRLIRNHADSDHYCGDENCTVNTPHCYEMEARAAMEKLTELLDPACRTLQPNRLTSPAERIYFNQWEKENKREPWLNHGFTALEHILCPTGQAVPDRPSQRDAEVAATVIQWLGTNCGGCFVRQCEKKIEDERAERRELGMTSVSLSGDDRDLFDRLIDMAIRNSLPPIKQTETITLRKYGLAEMKRKIIDVCHLMFDLFCYQTGEVSLNDAAHSTNRQPDQFKKIHALAMKAVKSRVERLNRKKIEKAKAS